jgi:hypothetical protein
MGILYWLIYIFAIILFLPLILQYIYCPIVIYFKHYHLANPQFIPIEIEAARWQLPASYYEHIDTLQALGFTPVAHLFTDGQVDSTTVFLTLFMNSIHRETAMVTQIECQMPFYQSSAHYIEFCTEFDDGYELNTNNFHLPNAYRSIPEKEVYRMRKIKDPQTLYSIHRYLVGEKPGVVRILPSAGNEVHKLCLSIQRDLNKQVEVGNLYLDEVSQKYRPTWIGAFLMTWKLVWPIRLIRQYLEDTRNERLVKHLKSD